MTYILIQQALIGIASSLFDIYMFTLVYSTFWSKKSYKKWLWLLFCFIYIIGGFAVSLISEIKINVFWSLFNCILAASFYQNKLLNRVVISVLFFVVANGIENAAGFLLAYFFKSNFSLLLSSNISFYLAGVIISKMFLFLAAKYIHAFHSYKNNVLSFRHLTPVTFLSLSSIIIALTIMDIGSIITKQKSHLFLSMLLILLTFSHLYVIYIIDKQIQFDMARQRLHYIEKQNQLQIQHYEKLYIEQQEIRRIKHDMKNTFISLTGMIKEKDIDSVLEYMTGKCNEINMLNEFSDTKSAALNSVLSAKQKEAQDNKIKIFIHTAFLELSVDEIEFCVLVANALDNAIEACKRLPQNIERYIHLSIEQIGYYIDVQSENPFLEQPDCQINKKTWKSDRKNHGFGLESMGRLAEKYDGHLSIKMENGVFYLAVLLKNRVR